ncbi:glycoside hydrolase family 71/99-like protein [Paenibacillus sp. MCAF20]
MLHNEGITGSRTSEGREGDVVGKLTTGYQGWFSAKGDPSPFDGWVHWSRRGETPNATGNLTFDLFPDVSEYEHLYETDLPHLGNGEPARLFSSYDDQTVDKHFEWMREYGIDCAALQRFGASTSDEPNIWRANRDGVAAKVKGAAEKHNRKFYVMYDTSGLNADSWTDAIKHDWTTNIVGSLRLTDSPSYAKQDGKLVVCIWGMGFTDRPGTAEESAELIEWFKERNMYVIGGVPTYWRTSTVDSKPDFLDAYRRFHMISPWLVGRFNGLEGADQFKTDPIEQDVSFTSGNGIDYQPVLWPGFCWVNLHAGPPNQIPRLHGDLMWRQAYNVASLGIETAYVAMFDEYDEATAIAKAAVNATLAPDSPYFLTLDADGVEVSSDFYLRLTGDINRMLRGELLVTERHPTPHTS